MYYLCIKAFEKKQGQQEQSAVSASGVMREASLNEAVGESGYHSPLCSHDSLKVSTKERMSRWPMIQNGRCYLDVCSFHISFKKKKRAKGKNQRRI